MQRDEKERVVEELAERLRASQTLIVADYRGLTNSEIDALRTRLLEHGARFSVVKNTLTRRAAEAAGADAVLALLEGPTAIAFLDAGGDPVAVAKALRDAARETRILTVRGGVMEGRTITAGDVESLATLPPTDVLRAQLLGAVTGPLTTVVGLFAAPLRDLVGVIDARIRQLEEHGERVEAQQPEASADAAAETEASTEPPAAEASAEPPAAEEATDSEPQPAGEGEPVEATETETQAKES